MQKLAKLVSCIALVTCSGAAFAAPGAVFSALEAGVSGADRFAASALSDPSAAHDDSRAFRLDDVTEACTQHGEVLSAYPGIYKLFHTEENSRIIRVFLFTDPAGTERRIEIYYTGGDWMQYGLTYIATDAGLERGRVSAYFVNDLSTPDREDGTIAPRINPFNAGELAGFIVSEFLDGDGNVKASYNSVAAFTRHDSGWKLLP